MYLKRALITQLGTREIRHIKTKRPEPCAIQDSDRWGRLIRFLSNFWGSYHLRGTELFVCGWSCYRVTSLDLDSFMKSSSETTVVSDRMVASAAAMPSLPRDT